MKHTVLDIVRSVAIAAAMAFAATSCTDGAKVDPDGPASAVTPEAVDLGLPSGTKWASFNVGATKPEQYGDYFAWGETKPYYESGYALSDTPVWKQGKEAGYDWASYKWCKGSRTTLAKYNYDSSYGTVDDKYTLDLEDDAARANWGGKWRIPTNEEQDELRNTNNCTWTWTTLNNVNGYMVTSKTNGNSIFLPAAGGRYDSSLGDVGSRGYYWSSSLTTDLPLDACNLLFHSSDVDWDDNRRCFGRSVRPVTEE